MKEHDFRLNRPASAARSATHHSRSEVRSATLAAPSRACALLALGGAISLACHTQPKVATTAALPSLELFDPGRASLDDSPSFSDLSSLNGEAAGSHGFVRVSAGHFSDDRGARLRFFGVNLTGSAALPAPAEATPLARHLRRLGFNAVRLVGIDGEDALLKNGAFAPEALDRLDFFSSQLKAQGIYFCFSLHAASGFPALEAQAFSRFPQAKVLDRFQPNIIAAEREFAKALLGHLNPKTGLRYADDPALLYVELSREDTLFPSRWGSPDDLPSSFRAELGQGYAAWLAQRTAEGLRSPGPADEEAKGELPNFAATPNARADYAQYLRFVERNTVEQLSTFLRQELGLQSMLINSQANFGGLAGVLREAELSDFIDVHGFWPDSDAPSSAPAESAPLHDRTQISATSAAAFARLAGYRVSGKPFVVSEFGSAAPSQYAAEMFPLLIGSAGFQDWDAVFAYAYADQKRDYEPKRIRGAFDIAGHPAKLAFVPMAASAFRRGLVSKGLGRVELSVPTQPSELPFAEDALPELWAEHGVSASAAIVHQLGVQLRPGAGPIEATSSIPKSSIFGSDTGELLWDPLSPHERFSIDAPALKLVCGRIANSSLAFKGVRLEVRDFAPGFACVSLLSLDEQPIASARRLLLNVVGLAQNASGPDHGNDAGPALAQYVPISVTLPADRWSVRALDANGSPIRTLPALKEPDFQFSTQFESATLAYAITR